MIERCVMLMLEHHRHLVTLALRLLALVSGAFLVPPGPCQAAQITWTNEAGGDWNAATNWSPNQVPDSGDNASITNPGTYVVTLTTNGTVANLVLGAGSGKQTLQAGPFPLTAGSVSINSGGALALNNAVFKGAVTVASGGLLRCYLATLSATLTIQSGGHLLLTGLSMVGDSDPSLNTNEWLSVQSGAELDAASDAVLYLYTPMTNAGLANFTNSGITFYNNGTSRYNGAVWNQAGGVLNLIGGSAISGVFGAEYLVNQGTINVANGNSTITVNGLTNLGTVATLPGAGTLRMSTLNGLGSLTGTYNAAAGTLIQLAAGNNPGISPGTPLVLAGAGQCQFVSGTLTLPTDVILGLVMTNGNLVLGPGFQGGAITNLVLNGITLTNNLPIAGTLAMTNGTLATTSTMTNMGVLSLNGVTTYGALNVSTGGLLNCSNSTLGGQVTVQSGGEFRLLGSTTYGAINVAASSLLSCSGSTANAPVTVQSGGKFVLLGSTTIGQGWLWVQNGAELDAASDAVLYLYTPMTNAGLANFTNSGISAIGGPVWNQPGGALNLIGRTSISGFSLINQGTINVANGDSTINVASLTNPGTVAALPGTGTLRIGTFSGLGSLTGTYNAAAGTLIQLAAGNNPGISPGTPLVLAGAGQCQFVSGTLTLTTDVVPGLVMAAGINLVLGPGFQGGAVTNLTLDSINLTNKLPIRGTLAMTNAVLTTTGIMTNMGVMSLNGMTVYGRLNVAAGGLLSCSGSTLLGAQVAVQSEGKLLLLGPTTIGQVGQSANTNDWLWVQGGGELDAAYIAPLYLFTAMTNAGFANFTNYGITIYNTGAGGYSGRVWNQPGGVLNLISTAGIVGGFGADYLVNQGTVNCLSPSASSLIDVSNFTNAGSLNALHGTLRLQAADLMLQPSGTLGVGLSSPTVYGVIDIPGNAILGGAFEAVLNNGFVPPVGMSFNVVTYGSFTGAFSDTNSQSIAAAPMLPGLQQTVLWGTTYSDTVMTITAQQVTEQFVFAGTGGLPGHPYTVLSSTNLALPRAAWVPLATNYFDSNGSFVVTIDVDPASRQQFFTYRHQ